MAEDKVNFGEMRNPGNFPAHSDASPAGGQAKGKPVHTSFFPRRILSFLWPKNEGPNQHNDGLREVVETVVFVVVLVLMLKSFAAEAFVIPTGSMAETLYGYQATVQCPECGYSFPVNFSGVVDPQDRPAAPVESCTCPNCRLSIPLPQGLFKPGQSLPDRNHLAIESDEANSGDRVLVAKFWTKSFFNLSPNRFDTVVFKYPETPQKKYTPHNYIKRLIGTGGETIAIHRGKLYVLSAEECRQANITYEEDPSKELDLWKIDNVHQNDERALALFEKRQGFKILQKPLSTLLAEMRIVYDNDHPAKDLAPYPRWVGNSAQTTWTAASGNGFHHDADDSQGIDFLRYRHILRGSGETRQLITDFMGYNSNVSRDPIAPHSPPGENWVSDLILECEATIEKPAGDFVMDLSKGPDRFQARWDLATGTCSLIRINKDGKEVKLASEPTSVKKGTYRLRFANVDDRLVVWVDNRLPFGEKVNYEPIVNDFGPDEKNDLEPASIGVKGASVSVHHIKLNRDTYYTQAPGHSDADVSSWSEPNSWRNLYGSDMRVRTIYVQPGHYLCMGDNSPESSDSRQWGLVPERLMLGRALLVYWPFNRAGRIR